MSGVHGGPQRAVESTRELGKVPQERVHAMPSAETSLSARVGRIQQEEDLNGAELLGAFQAMVIHVSERGQKNDNIWSGGSVTEHILLFRVSDNSTIEEKLIRQALCSRCELFLCRESSSLGMRLIATTTLG